MSGIGTVLASDGAPTPAPAPLSVVVGFPKGAGPFSVSGASGDSYSQFGGLIALVISGGTPPYTGSGVLLLGDPSGKLAQIDAGDVFHHTTIAWSGFALNEYESCYLTFDVMDSVGNTASSRFPDTGSIIFQRTS